VAETAVEALVPNFTDRVPVRSVPVMVTIVPARSCPEFGETDVIVGVEATKYVNAFSLVTVPVAPPTTTETTPTAWAGADTTIDVPVFERIEPSIPSNVTDVVVSKLVPAMVTDVPPSVEPVAGAIVVTDAGAAKVNAAGAVTVPESVVTVTLTAVALAALAGVSTVTAVSVRLTID